MKNSGKKRIWELDAARGLCIIGMVAVHFIYDLEEFCGIRLFDSALFDFVKLNGGILFILISGICASFSLHHFRRGTLVFACGLLVSAVTFAMVYLELAGREVLIYWGILHFLGFAMMTCPLYKKMKPGALLAAGAVLAAAGMYITANVRVENQWLFPLGFMRPEFFSADYFPVLPFTGWYMIGMALGKLLYRKKTTRLPGKFGKSAPMRALSCVGRHSLIIYLAHQPLLYGAALLLGKLISG